MIKSVLIIDDEQPQAENLGKAFKTKMPEFYVDVAFEEKVILDKIENTFYNIAIVDLRMDKFDINGFDIIKKIIEVNPFAKIIIVSAYVVEYISEIQSLLPSGKIQGIVEKTDFDSFSKKLFELSEQISNDFDARLMLNTKALSKLYAQAKLESNPQKKGVLFEDFVALLFGSMGFKHIYSRVKDRSLNEVDLLVRNDIHDNFIQRFGEYILIECKNKPEGSVNKNDFIVFHSKIEKTNKLAKFGVLITTGYITWNTYYEAIRESKGDIKIIFISNPEIEKLIMSEKPLEDFKKIIDLQVKDN